MLLELSHEIDYMMYLFGKCNDSIALWVIACIVDQVLLDNQV